MAAFKKLVVAVLVFVIAVAAGFAAFQVADLGEKAAAREADSVTNESIVQEVDLWQFVNRATVDTTAGFNESVTVYNSSDHELTKGTDYEWNATEGAIKYNGTASVTDGQTGNISYTYFRNTPEVQGLSAVIDPMVELLGRGGILVGGLALSILLIAFAGFAWRRLSSVDTTRRRR